jgi:hypothetical protein
LPRDGDGLDELETPEGTAIHAYLHRKEGAGWNANYWYDRAGQRFKRETLEAEWEALVEGLGSEFGIAPEFRAADRVAH